MPSVCLPHAKSFPTQPHPILCPVWFVGVFANFHGISISVVFKLTPLNMELGKHEHTGSRLPLGQRIDLPGSLPSRPHFGRSCVVPSTATTPVSLAAPLPQRPLLLSTATSPHPFGLRVGKPFGSHRSLSVPESWPVSRRSFVRLSFVLEWAIWFLRGTQTGAYAGIRNDLHFQKRRLSLRQVEGLPAVTQLIRGRA